MRDSHITFTAQDTTRDFGMGWALANTAVSDPANLAGILGFHSVGKCAESRRDVSK
jgi:hypothetical protein